MAIKMEYYEIKDRSILRIANSISFKSTQIILLITT